MTIINPAGNITALVEGNFEPAKRQELNAVLMKKYPTVEQVGFYSLASSTPSLTMAGGEFCGNATRSLAYLALNGEIGSIQIAASGSTSPLSAGIRRPNTSFSQMPIQKSFESVQQINPMMKLVTMEGISHLVISIESKLPKSVIKEKGMELLSKYNLLQSQAASGAIFVLKNQNTLSIQPVIWVRDIKTLFYESSCASGTTAVALVESYSAKKSKNTYTISQPNDEKLVVRTIKNFREFTFAEIEGSTTIIEKGELSL